MKLKLKSLASKLLGDVKKKAGADLSAVLNKQKTNLADAIMASKPAQEMKAEETKKTIKQYLPYIIAAAVALILLGYFARK